MPFIVYDSGWPTPPAFANKVLSEHSYPRSFVYTLHKWVFGGYIADLL